MSYGGKRIGAGRKKGFAAKNAEEARKLLSKMVMREIGPIGEALIAKAKRGDIAATRELFDRAWGKSTQSLNVETKENAQTNIYYLNNPRLQEIAARYDAEIKEILKSRH